MAYAGFILVEGLKGQSTNPDYDRAYSDILSFNLGVSQRGIQSMEDNPYETRPDFDEVTVKKFVDTATTGLFSYCTSGRKIKEVYIRADEQKQVGTMIMAATLRNVTVSRINYLGNPGDPNFVRPVEEISFKFGKIELQYNFWDKKGIQTFKQGWDLDKNEAWTADK